MRNYKEIAEIVKERGDAVIAERSDRARRRKSITLSVSGVAVSAAAAFCIWQNIGTDKNIVPQLDNSNIIEDMPGVTTSPDTEKVSAVSQTTAVKTSAAKKTVSTASATSASEVSSKATSVSSAVTAVTNTSSAAVTVSAVPAETTETATSYDYDFVYNEGRVIMKRFAALSTALLTLVNTTPVNAAGHTQYSHPENYCEGIQTLKLFVDKNKSAIDINGDGEVDIFDDYAFVRSFSSGCPEYIKENIDACMKKMKEFTEETGINVEIGYLPEFFVITQNIEPEYFDPNFYIDNCPDTYIEPVPLEYIRHDDSKFGITEFYDSMYYKEENGGFVGLKYHSDDPYANISPIHYFIENYLRCNMSDTNTTYNLICEMLDNELVDADINSDGVFNYDDIMMLYCFREQFYDDYSKTNFGYWDENDQYHSLDAAQEHEKNRTYAGFLEDYDYTIAFYGDFPEYDLENSYIANHKFTESEWEKATAFYDTALQYSAHSFMDIDEDMFIYYITNYNVDPEIFNDSYYKNNKDSYLGETLFGYLRKFKDIYEEYGVNAIREPGNKPVDPRFAKYDTEKMFPEYYAAVKNGELPEPDINKDGKVNIQDYAFFHDLFAEIEVPDAPSYMIYVTIDAPQAVRDAFNNDYDFNNNGVSCDFGELECIELYIAKAVGASDYTDIIEMLDKYYAENPSLDPMVKLNEIIKNMGANTTKNDETDLTEQKMQSYMSSIDLFKGINGDSNIDGDVDLSDAVLIMQSLANPNKYQLTPQGRKNADTNGDGVTTGDAVTIQRRLLRLE